MDERKQASEYRKIFRDIIRGYSECTVLNKKLYLKHLSAQDQVDLDDVYTEHLEKAIARGVEPEEETLKRVYKDGIWTEEKDKELSRLREFSKQIVKNKQELVLKSQIDAQNKALQDNEDKIKELEVQKQSLLTSTAESYATKRANDYYIIRSFYSDKELNDLYFLKDKDFSELYSEELKEYIDTYNSIFEMFDEAKIQEMILQEFYYIYFPFSDDTVGFFGRPVVELTYNQLKLIVYTKIFKNIFEKYDNIPEKIRKNPSALMDYGNISDEAREKMRSKYSGDADASTIMNATDEDYEYAGLEKPSDSPGISLQKAAEDKGGSLSMEDLMKLSGHRTE